MKKTPTIHCHVLLPIRFPDQSCFLASTATQIAVPRANRLK
jgi:hypothetical protein